MILYDSLSKSRKEISPSKSIGIYVCGITPYDSPHLGHARAAVIFDAFVRWLRHLHREVNYIRNITDIDDKIIERSKGEDIVSFTAKYIDEYHQMASLLNCVNPDYEPRVSQHIGEIIALVKKLIELGHAYLANGSVYFSVRSFKDYGRLSGRDIDELITGTRIESEEEKKDPLDFALWKSAKAGEPSWDSPWGEGRPGWHIECSAMSMKYLGETFDIHGGGNDLVFPHHENERAQSEAATSKEFAKIWMHNGLITLNNRKMSKSEGNVLSPFTLINKFGARTLRYYLLSVRYSSPLDVSEERLFEAKSALERFETFIASVNKNSIAEADEKIISEFSSALNDDFNTSAAFSILFEAIKRGNKGTITERNAIAGAIRYCGEAVGIDFFPKEEYRDEEIEKLIGERNEARREKNFARSDEIRQELLAKGIILEDTKEGTRWRKS